MHMATITEKPRIAEPTEVLWTRGNEAGHRDFNEDGELVKNTLCKELKMKGETIGSMASWAGTPAIKGSTESMRMMLLTFSLIGLQYVSNAYANEALC